MTGEGRIGRKAGPALRLFRRAARGLSTEFRNYADVLIWTSHGDAETQRRSTRAARTAGRALRGADRKRKPEPRASGRMPTRVWHRERRARPASVYGFHVP